MSIGFIYKMAFQSDTKKKENHDTCWYMDGTKKNYTE